MVIHTITDTTKLAADLASRIIEALPPHKTGILLLSGGSCIALEVALSRLLPEMKQLHVMLSDERFGHVGHPDSNWTQLTEAGFDFNKFSSQPTLSDDDLAATTIAAQHRLHSLLENSDYTIAILGMGADAHTAGLLPRSPALQSTELYSNYVTEQYQRVTITPPVFSRIDYALLYTAGDDKRQVLDGLDPTGSIDDQPVLLINRCRQFDIYNLKKES